jgi:hypothetical protein
VFWFGGPKAVNWSAGIKLHDILESYVIALIVVFGLFVVPILILLAIRVGREAAREAGA